MPKKLITPNIDLRVYIPENLYIEYKLIQKENGLPRGFFSQYVSALLKTSIEDFRAKCIEVRNLRTSLIKRQEEKKNIQEDVNNLLNPEEKEDADSTDNLDR
jgi:hypothetical protein